MILIAALASFVANAHRLNNYRFIQIAETGNIYNIESRLTTYFKGIGFKTVTYDEIADFTKKEKNELLFATYDYTIIEGASPLRLTLKNIRGEVIYQVAASGMAFTANGDMRIALNKIFQKMDQLNYKFKENNAAKRGESKVGSGVLISKNIVVTNYHVVNESDSVTVLFKENGITEKYTARILVYDKNNDLVLLSIKDSTYKRNDEIPYKVCGKVKDVGTSIFTMGYPMTNSLGQEVKITDGIISSKSGFEGDIVTYQITAPIHPGNSGGGLFDKKGNLIGITNSKVMQEENIGYAIKISYLLNLIDSAPIDIPIKQGDANENIELPELVRRYTPFVVIVTAN